MAKGLPWTGSYKNPGNPQDQYAPPASSYSVSPSEATNATQAIPSSNSPGPRGHSYDITSRTGNTIGAKQATTTDFVHPSIGPNPIPPGSTMSTGRS